jgi:hypothetical protein
MILFRAIRGIMMTNYIGLPLHCLRHCLIVLCVAMSVACAQAAVKTFDLAQRDVTAMVASSGALSGSVKPHFRSANVVHGFTAPTDSVTWTVVAPEDADYVVSVLFSTQEETQLEISSGDSVISAPAMLATWTGRPYFWRQELPGVLHLQAGVNRISLRLPQAKAPVGAVDPDRDENPRFGQGVTQDFHLFSI